MSYIACGFFVPVLNTCCQALQEYRRILDEGRQDFVSRFRPESLIQLRHIDWLIMLTALGNWSLGRFVFAHVIRAHVGVFMHHSRACLVGGAGGNIVSILIAQALRNVACVDISSRSYVKLALEAMLLATLMTKNY